jgi:hypothetical protein
VALYTVTGFYEDGNELDGFHKSYGTFRAVWILYVSYFLILILSKSRTSRDVLNTTCSQRVMFALTFINGILMRIKVKL